MSITVPLNHPSNYGSVDHSPLISGENLEVGAVAQAALKNSPSSSIDFWRLNREQKKSYALAMLCRGLKKGVLTTTEKARSTLGTLAGIQLSGLLKCQTQTSSRNWVSFNLWDQEERIPYSGFLPDAKSNPIGLKETLDGFLKLGVDTLTYASAGAWFLGHSVTPRIERFLSSKEDLLMRSVIGTSTEEPPTPLLSTRSSRISSLIEYLMPVLFDASQIALFIRFIRSVGTRLTFWPEVVETLKVNKGDLNFDGLVQLYEVVLEMLKGEDPVSDTTLYLLLFSGIVMYVTQAWLNFRHDLEVKMADAQVVPDDDLESVVSTSSSNS